MGISFRFLSHYLQLVRLPFTVVGCLSLACELVSCLPRHCVLLALHWQSHSLFGDCLPLLHVMPRFASSCKYRSCLPLVNVIVLMIMLCVDLLLFSPLSNTITASRWIAACESEVLCEDVRKAERNRGRE